MRKEADHRYPNDPPAGRGGTMQARLPILEALPRLATPTLVGRLASTSPRPIGQDPGLPTPEVFPTLTAEARLVPRRSVGAPRSRTRRRPQAPSAAEPWHPVSSTVGPRFEVCRSKAAFDLSQKPKHAGLISRSDGAGTSIQFITTGGAGDIGIALKNQPTSVDTY